MAGGYLVEPQLSAEWSWNYLLEGIWMQIHVLFFKVKKKVNYTLIVNSVKTLLFNIQMETRFFHFQIKMKSKHYCIIQA